MQRMYIPRKQLPLQRGVALFVVIVFVMLSMLLALWASRTSLFNEMVVGNDADYQRAFEAAQALLQDAELDIRGENPDGTACIEADKCRDKIGAAKKVPLDAQEVTPLLADLDQEATKCLHGLCIKRTGRQDFWNYTSATTPAPTSLKPGEVKLDDMTKDKVGARYGEFTNATPGSTTAPANPILADRSAELGSVHGVRVWARSCTSGCLSVRGSCSDDRLASRLGGPSASLCRLARCGGPQEDR